MHMEVGSHESVRRGGVEVNLPVSGDVESQERVAAGFRATFGIDPMDVEGMLSVNHPRP